MSDFEAAAAYVKPNEGGFVDRPNDKGGPTNYGITQDTLSRFLKRSATPEDVKNLSYEDAKACLKDLFWQPMGLDGIRSSGVATAVFDMGINRGPQKAMEYVMLTLSKLNVPHLDAADPEEFLRLFSALIKNGYTLIVKKHPENQEFLAGWWVRADRLLTLIHV